MRNQNIFKKTLLTVSIMILGACSTVEKQKVDIIQVIQEDTTAEGFHIPYLHQIQSEQSILNEYNFYQNAMKAIDQGDDALPLQFLNAQQENDVMQENIRKKWLKKLGFKQDWQQFNNQYSKLNPVAKDQEIECYAELSQAQTTSSNFELAKKLVESPEKLSMGCQKLITYASSQGVLNKKNAWGRVMVLISQNYIAQARELASAIGQPLPKILGDYPDQSQASQISLLSNIITPKGRNRADAITFLEDNAQKLSSEQKQFAQGILGLAKARDLNSERAIYHFQKADKQWLNKDQWEWYARSALRTLNWQLVGQIIRDMPESISATATWRYWLARSYAQENRQADAQALYEKVAASGRNFYAILAHDALNQPLVVKNNVMPVKSEQVNQLMQDGAIQKALVLFKNSLETDSKLERATAQQQWNYAIRDYNEDTLLVAAQLAYQNNFYEMAIYSADKTHYKLNYHLRFLSPYQDLVNRYAAQNVIAPSWIYGLIRQESRFKMTARSTVGASGLMQIMPATARELAQKVGLNNYQINDLDHNIQMGTWFLADIKRRLGNEVLATAGYNAGPSRPPKWKANIPLEGAIYTETIPFNETRNYVKKVMSNTIYYAHLFNEPQMSLTQRLGIITPRN